MQKRREFLQGIMAASAAVAAGFRPVLGATGVQATVSAATPAFSKEISDTVRMVCGLLRECRIKQVVRNGENTLQITYVRDSKRRHEGPLFDWIEANARPRAIVISHCVDSVDVTHLGEYVSFPVTPALEVEVEWLVSNIENCPIMGYREVTA